MKQKLRMIGLLLSPSLLSLVVTAGLVILLSASTLIKYGLNTNSLYTLLLGSGSSTDLINNAHLSFSFLYQNIFGNPILNKILFFLFWMLTGLVVYLLISGIAHSISQADETVHEMNFVHTDKTKFLEQHIKRFGVQLAVFVVICLYTILFLKALLPFALLSIQIGTQTIPDLLGLGYGILGVLILSISLYLYVILLRLLLLRIRVFGTDQ